jgi:hypothetical protein
MARPTDLNPELQQQLVTVLSSGVPIKDACAYVGISDVTYYNWMNRGQKARKGDERFVEFFNAATRARVAGRLSAVTVIRKSIQDGNSEDARWFLERSDPANWGRKDVLIQLGIDPALLKQLKQTADEAGVDLASVFEAMINEFANVERPGTSKE